MNDQRTRLDEPRPISRANRTTAAEAPSSARGALLGLLAFAVFSTHDAMIKSIHGLSVFQVVFFVVLFSFVPFSFYLALDSNQRSLRPNLPLLTALRCLFTFGSLNCAFYAFSVLPLAEVYSLVFAAPILITILAIPVLGEKVRLIRWVAIVLGLVGVLVVLRPGSMTLSLGHVAGLTAAVCVAFTAIVTRRIGAREHSLTLILYPMLTNVLFSGICLVFVYQPMSGVQMATMAAIGVLSVLGQTLMIMAYRISQAQFVAPMQYSQMLWAIVFGAILFHETIDRTVIYGSLIIILSGLLFVWREVVASVTQPILRTRNLRMSAGPQIISSEVDHRRREAQRPTDGGSASIPSAASGRSP